MSNEFDDKFEQEIEKLESWVNSPLVNNSDQLSELIGTVYNASFGAFNYVLEKGIMSKELSFTDEEYLDLAVPTTFLFGSFGKDGYMAQLMVNTYDTSKEDEDVMTTVDKTRPHLLRMRHILKDMDFCIVSYPVIREWDEIHGQDETLGLLSIIFTPEGNLGKAFSVKYHDEGEESSYIKVGFETPKHHGTMPYKSFRRNARKDREAKAYSRLIEEFYHLPTIPKKEPYYELVDQLKRNNCSLLATENAFADELKDEIITLPLSNFVLLNKDTQDYFQEILKAKIQEMDNLDPDTIESLLEINENLFGEEE
nr:hypothetical protein [uncultured Mediterranean phage uvMED]